MTIGSIFSIVTYCGVFGCLVLTVAELLKGRRAVVSLVLVAVLLGSVQLRIGLAVDGYLFDNPYTALFLISSIFGLGPALLYFADYMLQYDYFRRFSFKIHAFLLLLSVLAEAIFNLVNTRSELTTAISQAIITPQYGYVYYIVVVAIGLVIGYLITAFFGFWLTKKNYDVAFSKFAFVTIATPIVAAVLAIYAISIRDTVLLNATGSLLTLTAGYLLVFASMRSTLFENLREEIHIRKYAKSLLVNTDTESLKSKLEDLMDQEKVYRHEKLTLPMLADLLDITYNRLSELINTHYGMNFSQLVNKYRIAEARQILIDEPDGQILAIAYKVGFNSKSAFNEQFRKHTGLSPSQFRKTQKSKHKTQS